MVMISIENYPITLKQVLNVFDLGYLGVERIFRSNYHPYQIERRKIWNCYKKKKNTTKVILERES